MSRFFRASLFAALIGCETDSTVNNGDVRLAVTARASVDARQNDGVGVSRSASVSADGRFVAFTSTVRALHPDDTDTMPDVLVKDLQTGAVHLASRADGPSGAKGDGPSSEPHISGNGRYVAFASLAGNLHPDDIDPPAAPLWDIYVRDLVAHTTVLMSRRNGATGGKGDSHSHNPRISHGGGCVAFETDAPLDPDDGDLPDGYSFYPDIYVRDRVAATTVLANRAGGASGVKATFRSFLHGLSADGRRVMFTTQALNVHPDVTTGYAHNAYVRDLTTFQTILASRAPGVAGAPCNLSGTHGGSLSADGRRVVFVSDSTNLLPDGDGLKWQVYLRDLDEDSLLLVSRGDGPSGAVGDRDSSDTSVSEDGRFVAFAGTSTTFVSDGLTDTFNSALYLRDTRLHQTQRLSVRTFGIPGNSYSSSPALTADGRFVAFESNATNLVDDDGNGLVDVFVRGPLR
jgi:Tol biopolymer transport system component